MPVTLNRNIRQSVMLDQETKDKLREVAYHTRLSENEIINKALAAYLKRYKINFVFGEVGGNYEQ